jgi:hypothetical protein
MQWFLKIMARGGAQFSAAAEQNLHVLRSVHTKGLDWMRIWAPETGTTDQTRTTTVIASKVGSFMPISRSSPPVMQRAKVIDGAGLATKANSPASNWSDNPGVSLHPHDPRHGL